MSSIKLKIKIFLKAIFHTLLGRTRLKAWILRAFSRDYELDSAKLAELISKPLAKDAPNGDFIASLTSFPARVGILKYALHSIFSQDLRAKKVILVLSVDEFLDSANCAKSAESNLDSATPTPLISLDSFSQKGCTPHPAPPTRQKLRFFAFRGRASLSPLLAKNQRSHYCSLDSDFLHHEAGEFSGASHGFNVDSADSQNLQNRLPRRFCESARNDEYIRDSSPTAQNDKFRVRVAESALDSANLSKSQNLVEKPCHIERSEISQKIEILRYAQNDKFRVRVAEFALDSALLDNLLPAEILAFKKFGLEIMWVEKNLRQYNKIIPILRAFPRENIITLDDDIYYNPRTFSTLHSAHLSNKRVIWAHKARIVPFSAHKIADFFEWKIIRKRNKHSQNLPKFNIFLEGCGGVFYPPNCLYEDAMDSEKFLRLAPKADDIWLWAMALLKGTKIACVKPPLMGDGAAFTNSASNPALWHYNMNGGNDKQMRAMLAEYPQILRILAQEKAGEKIITKVVKRF